MPAEPKPPVSEKSVESQVVNLGASHAVRYGGNENREKLWDVNWQTAQLTILESNKFVGRMQTVNGSIFQKGKVVCTYEAKEGIADKQQDLLDLRGSVKLVSLGYGEVLTCDEVVYDGTKKIAKAKGHVRAAGKMGSVTGPDELWATPDLKRIATPDLFFK